MHDDEVDIRPFTLEAVPAATRVMDLAFGEACDEQDLQALRSVVEPDRTLGAYDGDTMVGTLATYSHDLSVPGGSTACGGLTWVSVSPTHRRRGILRQMITRHLLDVHERGEAFGALWASETAIYGRFGYGLAVEQQRLSITVDRALEWESHAPPPADHVRLVPVEMAADVLTPLYEAARRRRAGAHARDDAWWRFQALGTRKSAQVGMARKHVAVATIDGEDAAYAIYGSKEDRNADGAPLVMRVQELAGRSPAAEAAMWRYLLSHDLLGRVVAPFRPLDDSLPMLLTDSRRVSRTIGDSLHVRVVDLPAALRSRTYRDSVGVTLELHDDLLPHNAGTWRVEVAPEGVSVVASDDPPQMSCDIRAVGSLLLGDVPAQRLVAAGAITCDDPALVGAVDAAFGTAEAGWVPEVW